MTYLLTHFWPEGTEEQYQSCEVLVVQTRVDLVPWGSIKRSEYKSMRIER